MEDVFYRSAEIRWFLQGQSQRDQLLNWFMLPGKDVKDVVVETKDYVRQPDAAPFVKLELPRPDEYLLLPECDTVSVKQRQGKLEVKALVAGPRPFSQGAVVGRVDQWVKWSFDPSNKTFQDGMTLGNSWMASSISPARGALSTRIGTCRIRIRLGQSGRRVA